MIFILVSPNKFLVLIGKFFLIIPINAAIKFIALDLLSLPREVYQFWS